MNGFEDEIRGRLDGTAGELARSAYGQPAPGLLVRAVRRHRNRTGLQLATATLLVAAVAVPMVTGPDRSGGSTLATRGGQSEAPADPGPAPSPVAALPPAAGEPSAPAAPSDPPTAAESVRPPAPSPAAPGKPACGDDAAAEPVPAGIRVWVEASDAVVARGGSVTLTIRVRNEGVLPVRYTESGYHYDFWAADGRGTVWRWSVGRAFTTHLMVGTFQPGQEFSATETWDLTGCPAAEGVAPAPLAAGRYAVRGLWVGDAETNRNWVSDPIGVEIR